MSSLLPDLLTAEEVVAASNGKILVTDTRLPGLIKSASEAVRKYCRWHVAPVITETVTVPTQGGRLVLLPTLRVVDVTGFKVAGVEQDVATLDWATFGMVRLSCQAPTSLRGVEATIIHGFESAPDVAQVAAQIVLQAMASPMGATREQAGLLSVTWGQTAPGVSGGVSVLDRDVALLDPYRLEATA